MDKEKLIILIALIPIILILLCISFRYFSLDKSFTAEEVDFVKPIQNLAANGSLEFYQAENLPNGFALYHPPTYIYLMAGIVKLVSFINPHMSLEGVLRSWNTIFIYLTAIMMIYFCPKFFPKKDIVGVLAAILFLINYYVFSSSLIIDIDPFSTFAIFGFIFSVCMYYKESKHVYFLSSVVFLILALGNRYPIAIITYLAILFYFFKRDRSYIDNEEEPVYPDTRWMINLGCYAIFFALAIWSVYSILIVPGTFFSFIDHNAALSSEVFTSPALYISSFLLNIAQVIRLFTPPVVILFILSLFHFRKSKDVYVKVLWVSTLAIFLLFILVPRPAFGYPRYFLSMMPGLFILIGLYVYDVLKTIKKKDYAGYVGDFLIYFTASLALFVFFNLPPTYYASDGLIKATDIWSLGLICIIPFVYLINNFYVCVDKEKKIALVLFMLALLFSYNLYFDIRYVQHDPATENVGEYLKAHTLPGDTVICPKAIGFYFGGKYYANDYYRPNLDALSPQYLIKYMEKSAENPEMDDAFFWSNGNTFNEKVDDAKYAVLSYKLSYQTPEEKIGSFYIYKIGTD